MIKNLSLRIQRFLVIGVALISALICTVPAHAVTGSDFRPGQIIDDAVFYNKNSMSIGQIQDFLNSKNPVCDRWGTQPYAGSTRRAYSEARGITFPLTCLKDYAENTATRENNLEGRPIPAGAKSAAHIIWDAAQQYGINPQVLIVLLQKEQALVLDDWPWPIQFRSAMGYGCPDSAPCDNEYYGFYNQVTNAARQFRRYANFPNEYNFRIGSNFIAYNPNGSCGGSTVSIINQATASLYNYTPYQPNAAALANLYDSGDSCSAYGNRNFWRIFNDWFGPSSNPAAYFAVIQQPGSPHLFLVTAEAKHYIPTAELYNTWGLSRFPIQQVTSDYFNSLPTYHDLGRLLKDQWNNYFFVDNGQTHYIREGRYFAIWGLDPGTAVRTTGLVNALPGGDWLGRFIKDADPNSSQIWLMDGGRRHLVPADSNGYLYHWRFTPDQLTRVGSAYLNSRTDSGAIGRYVSSGGRNFIVDAGRILYFEDSNVEKGYGNHSFMPVNLWTLSMQPLEQGRVFVMGSSDPWWYMIENGRKHYIPNIEMAKIWGYKDGQPLTRLSDQHLSTFTDGGPLTHMVQTSSPALYWLVDGSKRYMPTTSVVDAWVPKGHSLPTYSHESLNLLQRGDDLTSLVKAADSPYTYAMDNGKKRYLPLPDIVNAWGSPRKEKVTLSTQALINTVPEDSFVSCIVKQGSEYYLLMNGYKYPIDPDYARSWRADNNTPVVSAATIQRFETASTLKGTVKINGTYYLMDNLYKIPVQRHLDAYGLSDGNTVTLSHDYFATKPDASYLVRSTDASDTRMWLINQGKKILLDTFEARVSYGYISRNVSVTHLTPAILQQFADSTDPSSLLVAKPGAGVKFINFGYALGFPDGQTVASYQSDSNPIIMISPSIYDRFVLERNTSKIIRDDSGKHYVVENGAKRFIQNNSLLNTTYGGVPRTYLESTTMNLLPSGASVN